MLSRIRRFNGHTLPLLPPDEQAEHAEHAERAVNAG